MIYSACLHPLLADPFSRIDWDVRKQFILVGDLASIVSVLPDILPKSFRMKVRLSPPVGKDPKGILLRLFMFTCHFSPQTLPPRQIFPVPSLPNFMATSLNLVSMKKT
jgi:hypothetical protein